MEALPRRTIEDFVARGLLATDGRRFSLTRAGDDALATARPPAAARVSARDDQTRAAALRTFSPHTRALLKAYRSALGGDLPKPDFPIGGDNRLAAVHRGLRSR